MYRFVSPLESAPPRCTSWGVPATSHTNFTILAPYTRYSRTWITGGGPWLL